MDWLGKVCVNAFFPINDFSPPITKKCNENKCMMLYLMIEPWSRDSRKRLHSMDKVIHKNLCCSGNNVSPSTCTYYCFHFSILKIKNCIFT